MPPSTQFTSQMTNTGLPQMTNQRPQAPSMPMPSPQSNMQMQPAMAPQFNNPYNPQMSPDQMIPLVMSISGGNPSKIPNAIKYAQLLTGTGEYAPENMMPAQSLQNIYKLNNADNLLNIYQSQLGGLGLQDSGPMAKLSGLWRDKVAAPLGFDQEADLYNQFRQGSISQLVRALGDSQLSDTDIRNAMKLLPTLYDTEEQANMKIGYIRNLIDANRTSQMGSFAPQGISPMGMDPSMMGSNPYAAPMY